MAYNETNGVYLAYLTSADGNSNFFLYDDSNATFAPYEEIDISDTTTIVLLSDTSVKLPSNYAQTTLTLNGQEFPVWPVSYTHLDVYKRQLQCGTTEKMAKLFTKKRR